MANNKAVSRSVKSRQLKSGILFHTFDGTQASPVDLGQDGEVVSTITKLGTGNYTLILTHAYEQDLHPVGLYSDVAQSITVTAVAEDRITILCEDETGAAVDGTVYMTLATFDNRFKH